MSNNISARAYRIETPRTVIRCWNPEDAPLLKAAVDASRDHLRPWVPWVNRESQSIDEQVELLRRFRGQFDLDQDFIYGILNQNETQVLGGTGLHTRVGEGAREIGYWIHVDYINQGYATEVVTALTRVAFEIDKVNRVEIHCDPDNVRSAAVPNKIGFIHEATLRNRLLNSDSKPRDTMIWTLFADEYSDSLPADAEIKAFDALGRRIL